MDNKQENLKALQKLAKVFSVDNIVTQDTAEEILKGIIKIIVSYKKSNEELNEKTIKVVDDLLSKIDRNNENVIYTLDNKTKTVEKQFNAKLEDIKQLIDEVRKLKPKDGLDGKDADEDSIVNDVLAKIKLPEYEVYTLEEKGEEIVKEINALPLEDEYKIDASHIKNLPRGNGAGGSTARNLYQLHDVQIDTPTDNQVLTYDSTTNTWKNEGVGSQVIVVTANYNVPDSNMTVIATEPVTVTLPAIGSQSIIVKVSNQSTGDVTVVPTGADLVHDDTELIISNHNSTAQLQSISTIGWVIV